MESRADTGARQERSPGLPEITAVEIKRARYDPPRRFYREGRLVSMPAAIEFLVRTAAELPVMDLPPILFVGETKVDDYAMVGDNLYRFRAYDVQRLTRGARISLGWPYAPRTKVPSRFVFELTDSFPVA